MIIVTPISTKQSLDLRVIDGVQRQTVPCNHFVGCAEGIEHSQRCARPEKLEGEMRSRRLNQRMVEDVGDKYMTTMDRDVILYPEAMREMQEYLNQNPNCGAVALRFDDAIRNVYHHINMKCTMMLRALYVSIIWDMAPGCFCVCVKKHVENNGYSMEYLKSDNRAYEIL